MINKIDFLYDKATEALEEFKSQFTQNINSY